MAVDQKIVGGDDDDIRLDRFFKRYFKDVTHVALEKALRKGSVRVNGKRVKASARLHEGDTIRIPPFETKKAGDGKRRPGAANQKVIASKITPAAIAMIQQSVVYKDAQVIIINKPAGLAVQGGSKITLSVDALLDALTFDAKERPKLVHRLDKDTSGALMLARTNKSAARMAALFKGKGLYKEYLAIVAGVPDKQHGKVDVPIAKSEGKNQKVRSNPEGQRAITEYHVLDHVGDMAALVRLMPITGRTHQLRVHMSILDTPIAGDGKYGGGAAFIEDIEPKLHLHAWKITFPDERGIDVTVTAPLPVHMRKSMVALGLSIG